MALSRASDLAPHDVLVDERAHIVDWAWPTRGAAWIDLAVLALRLLEAGHPLAAADAFAPSAVASTQNFERSSSSDS